MGLRGGGGENNFETSCLLTPSLCSLPVVFPQDLLEKGLEADNFAMLGLGDIVIPGKRRLIVRGQGAPEFMPYFCVLPGALVWPLCVIQDVTLGGPSLVRSSRLLNCVRMEAKRSRVPH